MGFLTVIGLVAATLTSSAGLPQVLKSFKTKSTRDLSWIMIFQILLGTTLWAVYGIFAKDIVIIFAQAVAYLIYIFLLIVKIKYNNSHVN